LQEWDWEGVGEADVVDEDGDVEVGEELAEGGVVCVFVLGEVHGVDFGLEGAVFGFQGVREIVEFGLRARDEEEVEAFCGELGCVFFADAVGGACNDCPAAFGTEGGEL